jgi:hypothetical protein
MDTERRIARDGQAYTRLEFNQFYEENWLARWQEASPTPAGAPQPGPPQPQQGLAQVAHNDSNDVGWFPAVLWSARVEQDHRQGCSIAEGVVVDIDSSNAGQSLACLEVVDLVAVVDCLMLSGSCAVLDFLDLNHAWACWPDSSILRDVCKASLKWVGTYHQQCRLRQRNYALELLPTFATDVKRYGEPFQYWPWPCWRKWKVEVWRYFDGNSRGVINNVYGEGWNCSHTYWMNSLADLSAIPRNMWTNAGLYKPLRRTTAELYKHRRLELSSWVWDHTEEFWQEEEHV